MAGITVFTNAFLIDCTGKEPIDGAAGYAYLLKDRVAEGNQLARAVREVAAGGSVLDPKIVEALLQPVTDDSGLTAADEVPWVFLWQQHDLYGVANWIEWTPRADEKVWMYEAKVIAR